MHAAFRRALVLALQAVLATACAGGGARYQMLAQELARTELRPASLDDDPFRAAPALEREALVRAVLQRNPTLRSARAAWRAALARHPQQTALADPMLGMAIGPRSFGAAEVRDGWKVDVSQEIPFPGKLALRGEVALAEAEAMAGDFEAARLELALLASLLFDDYVLAARSIEVEEHHIRLLEELEQGAIARLESGEVALQDPVWAAAELAHRRHDRIRYATALRTIAQQMNLLLHRPPLAPIPPPPATIEIEAGDDAAADATDALVSTALAERPELRAAYARIGAGQAAVGAAALDYFPDFTVVAGWDAFWQERPLQPSIGIQLNVPLQRERRAAALDEAQARLEQAESEADAKADEVRFSVASAAERLREARHVLHLQETELVPAAREFSDAARIAYQSGTGSFETLIEAERGLRSAELEREAARADVSRRRAELDRALGRIPGTSRGATP
jgi:outer membrane protein TolC